MDSRVLILIRLGSRAIERQNQAAAFTHRHADQAGVQVALLAGLAAFTEGISFSEQGNEGVMPLGDQRTLSHARTVHPSIELGKYGFPAICEVGP